MRGLGSQGLENQFGGDCDRRFQRAINRAAVRIEAVDPGCGFAVRFERLQLQNHVNAANHQDVVFELNFADRFGNQFFVRSIYLTRFQRAPEGAGESTRGRRHDVIQGRGMRFQDGRRHLVVLRYGAVHSKYHGLFLGRQISPAYRALHALNADIGAVNNIRHNAESISRRKR